MAKNDNLKDFLTDVADAIREKKGTEEKINPQNFSEEIRSIKSGGDGVVEEKDIHFYDYDGTLLYSYTIEEAQALKELPPLPSHEGLICQEWNWDYEDVIALDRPMDIGATYITDDGKTRIFFNLKYTTDVELHFVLSGSKKGIVDWGDSSPTYELYATDYRLTHTYPSLGKYLVTIDPAKDTFFEIGGKGSDKMDNGIEAVYLGKNVTGTLPFKNSSYLKEISITKDTINIGFATFFQCPSLKYFVFPKECVLLQKSVFYKCSNLKGVSIPAKATGNLYGFFYNSGVEKVNVNQPVVLESKTFYRSRIKEITLPNGSSILSDQTFANTNLVKLDLRGVTIDSTAYLIARECANLRTVVFPKNAEVLGAAALYGCSSLLYVIFPEDLTKIGTACFGGALWMSYIKIPSPVVEIEADAFYSMLKEGVYDFTACNQVPTLINTAFTDISKQSEIRVPEDLYDEWIVATNWATYADYIKAYPRTTYDYDALVAELEAKGEL